MPPSLSRYAARGSTEPQDAEAGTKVAQAPRNSPLLLPVCLQTYAGACTSQLIGLIGT
jgi:hypothetical protein